MAGDPFADCTSVSWSNTTDTTASYYIDTNSTCTYETHYYYRVEEDIDKIQKLIRKQIIKEMKDQWNDLKNSFKPVPKMRPSIQLRGVCLNGRGWA
jgi:hypothetical protein